MSTLSQHRTLVDELLGYREQGSFEGMDWESGLLDSARDRVGGNKELSPKQVAYLKKALYRCIFPVSEPASLGAELGPVLSSTKALMALFQAAKQNLKYPKIKFKMDGGSELVFRLAGSKSKYSGNVVVTGPVYPSTLYAIIGPSSVTFTKYGDSPKIRTFIEKVLQEPLSMAQMHGKHYGNCAFCAKELTDPTSVKAGFGPVCAKSYGLWDAYKAAK